jgi:anti-sigma factor RsiW
MTEPRLPDPDLTDDDAAELAAFLDGALPADRRAAVEARLAADPALAAALDRRRRAADLISAAVSDTQAPHDLRLRIDALGMQPPARSRPRRRWLPFAALASTAAAAAVAVVIALGGDGLSVRGTVAAALRTPVATASLDPVQPRLLRERVEHVRFPNFAAKFGWRPVGVRTDELDGRQTRTVFYEKGGHRIAYTIVAGEALGQPEDARRTVVGGVELRTLRVDGRTVVTWRRAGRTCVLSGAGVDARTLRELAAWKGQGAVRF